MYASINGNDVNTDLIELKLPSSLRIQLKAFDAKTYEVEDPIVFVNDVSLLETEHLAERPNSAEGVLHREHYQMEVC